MEEPQWTITRREILKRGAIVGGGVLWIAPVVQTLGMRPAMAQAVSGGQCKMTMELVSCASVADGTATEVVFRSCVPAGCPCNPLPADHLVQLITLYGDGSSFSTIGGLPGQPSGCFAWKVTLAVGFDGTLEVYALCGSWDQDHIGMDPSKPITEGDHLTVTGPDIARCLEQP